MILRASFAAALLLSACGSLSDERAGTALSGPTATPAAAATPGAPTGAPPPGYVRIKDDAGGWSIDVPSRWLQRAGAQHGVEVRTFDPDVPDAMNRHVAYLPPPDGMLVTLQMQQNHEQLDPKAFSASFQTTGPGQQVREHASIALAGQPAEFYSLWRSQPSDFQSIEPTLYWYVRSPFFDDRMVVIHALPGASPLRAEAERIVASLQFYRPVPPALTPTVSRQQAIDQVTQRPPGKPSTMTRVEAKLVFYKEWERAAGGGRSFVVDPDALVWVVAYTGPDIRTRRGDPCPWGVSVISARPPETVGAFQCGPGAWPDYFDRLVDRGN